MKAPLEAASVMFWRTRVEGGAGMAEAIQAYLIHPRTIAPGALPAGSCGASPPSC